MALAMRGVAAELRWGYQRAATLGSWTLSDGTLVATVLEQDAFRVSQSPLTFVAGPRVVRPLEGLQIAGRTLTARVSRSLHEPLSIRPA